MGGVLNVRYRGSVRWIISIPHIASIQLGQVEKQPRGEGIPMRQVTDAQKRHHNPTGDEKYDEPLVGICSLIE